MKIDDKTIKAGLKGPDKPFKYPVKILRRGNPVAHVFIIYSHYLQSHCAFALTFHDLLRKYLLSVLFYLSLSIDTGNARKNHV